MDPIDRLEKLNTNDCLWIYILSILKENPLHAYPLRNYVEKRFSFKPGNVTSYKVLYLLTKSGHVSKTKNGRRVVYMITPKGRKELVKAISFYKNLIKSL